MAVLGALVIGAVAAVIHLTMTSWRARVGLSGHHALALIGFPLSVGLPAACLFGSLWLSPVHGWWALVSHGVVRTLTLGRMARR